MEHDVFTEFDDAGLEGTGGVSQEALEKAEEILGFKFAQDFREFLLKYGTGILGSFEIFGIVSNPESDTKAIPNGVWLTCEMRGSIGLLKNHFVFGEDGIGGYFVLNCNATESAQSGAVLYIDSNGNIVGEEAESFVTFLRTCL